MFLWSSINTGGVILTPHFFLCTVFPFTPWHVHNYEDKNAYVRFVRQLWVFMDRMISAALLLPRAMSVIHSSMSFGHDPVTTWQNDTDSPICTECSVELFLLLGIPTSVRWTIQGNDEHTELITSWSTYLNSMVSALIWGHILWSSNSLNADHDSALISSFASVLEVIVCWGNENTWVIQSIIIIAAFIMRTYPSSEDVQDATFYYYPGRWIQFQDRTYSAQFPLPREHSLPSCLSWRSGKCIIPTQHILHILPGTHLYTWVESSNVDKVSCCRGQKCQAWTGIEPATLWSRVKGSLQYIPRHLHIIKKVIK